MGNCSDGQCSTKQGCCSSQKSCGSGCDMTDMVMCLADKAWAELMKEKMKAEFEKHRGEKMDAVAAAAVEASIAKWTAKMDAKTSMHQHKDKLRQAFM